MNALFRSLAVAALLTSSAALAQVDVRVGLPSIHFEVVPRLIEITAGVQVVEDHDEEVFFVDRHYYVRHGDTWYRSRDHRGNWVVVEHRYVPVTLVKSPRGKYRRYRRHEHREVHVVREAPRHESRRVVYVEDDHDHDHDHGGGKHKGHGGKGHGKGHGGKKHKD